MHDQLPGAAGQGDSRAVRHPQGVDDDHPLVHERSEPARPAAQGSAPRARGGAVDDSDDDRRRVGGRRSASGAEGQARWLRDARADAERLGRRPQRVVDKKTTGEEVNAALREAAAGPLKGILAVSDEELVSIDFRGNPNSSIVDAPYTKVMDGDFVKVLSWYDNEWGYSSRCVDLLRKLVARGL